MQQDDNGRTDVDDSSQPDRRSERGLLGDTPSRAYGDKLALFNRFAEPEIRQLIEMTGLRRGQRVLDAGCGVGLATAWFRERVGESGLVVGCDLSGPHLQIARDHAAPRGHGAAFVQC